MGEGGKPGEDPPKATEAGTFSVNMTVKQRNMEESQEINRRGLEGEACNVPPPSPSPAKRPKQDNQPGSESLSQLGRPHV